MGVIVWEELRGKDIQGQVTVVPGPRGENILSTNEVIRLLVVVSILAR